MANGLYDKGRESFLKGEISWSGDNIKVVLVVIGVGHYVVDLANDQFLTAIASGDRTATSGNFTTKTTTAGVADADDITFTAVTGSSSGALVIYQDTGAAATSRLIAYIDGSGGTYSGLPITPNGSDINVQWPNDSNKIFKL